MNKMVARVAAGQFKLYVSRQGGVFLVLYLSSYADITVLIKNYRPNAIVLIHVMMWLLQYALSGL